MSGLLSAAGRDSAAASAAAQDVAQSSHVGTTEFRNELDRQKGDVANLQTGHEKLGEDVQQQRERLDVVEPDVVQLKNTTATQGAELANLRTRADDSDRTVEGHTSTQATQATSLRSHDTRLTNLEAGQAHDLRPFNATGEIGSNTRQIDALQAVHDHDPTTFTTGHGSGARDRALQARIQSDPMVHLQQAKLSSAIQRMQQANQPGEAGSRTEFLKAAEDAEKSAKDLDTARKTIESTGVFQSGNSFSKHATKINAAIAAVSIAAAGTTGGLIAANNETQREKKPSQS